VGGFAAPKVTKVLNCTGYLKSETLTLKRLFETTQMVVDCMTEDGLRPFVGLGWQSTLRVRFLHSQVRMRISRLAKKCPHFYPSEQMGLPINQEDLIGTALSFSVAMDLSLRRMGMEMTAEEKCDFLAVWRYVGHLIGIEDRFSPLHSWHHSEAMFESIVMHQFDPSDESITFANRVLTSLVNHPPTYWSFTQHASMSRLLIGDQLADAYGLPDSAWCRYRCLLFFYSARAFLYAASKVSWLGALQIAFNQRFVGQLVARFLGHRCTFTMSHPPPDPSKERSSCD